MRKRSFHGDLMEEILSRVPPKSLVRFRAVSKPWSNLFNEKRFIKNHKMTFHFVLTTKSKIYSVNVVNPNKTVVRELTLDILGLDESHPHQIPKNLIDCNEFLLCHINQGFAVWNPWSSTWKDNQAGSGGNTDGEQKEQKHDILMDTRVSLNGTLYWVTYSDDNKDRLFITGFDFLKDKFFDFCYLPCGKNHPCDALVLGVFKGDRFSLLKQCYATKEIEIFVTKDNITTSNCDDVVWMSFMKVSIPNFPDLVQEIPNFLDLAQKISRPIYFIDNDNRLIVCSCDKTGQAWIYVVWENKLFSKIQMDSVVDP